MNPFYQTGLFRKRCACKIGQWPGLYIGLKRKNEPHRFRLYFTSKSKVFDFWSLFRANPKTVFIQVLYTWYDSRISHLIWRIFQERSNEVKCKTITVRLSKSKRNQESSSIFFQISSISSLAPLISLIWKWGFLVSSFSATLDVALMSKWNRSRDASQFEFGTRKPIS